MACPKADASMVEEDREAMAEVLVLVERLGRKVDSLIDPELRDGLEDEVHKMLVAVYAHVAFIESGHDGG